ncbi:MAG: hypothetical protein Q4B50_03360, partial [Bacillota bacterium]|nr:hypothetical protein [Bacillota bacterium]
PILESIQQPQNVVPQGLTQERIANNIDAFLAQQGGVAPEIGDVDTSVYNGKRPRLEEMKFEEIAGLKLSQHDTAIMALAACFSSDVKIKTAVKNPELESNPNAVKLITVEKDNDPKTSLDRVLNDLLITQAPQSFVKAGPVMKAARRYVNTALNDAAAGNYEKLGKLVADGIRNTNELLADPNMNLGHKFATLAGMGGELCDLLNGNAKLKEAAEKAGLTKDDMEKMASANALGKAWSRCKNSQETLTANFLKGTLPDDYKNHVAATAQMYNLEAQCKKDPSMKFNNVYKDNPGMNEATIQKMVDTVAIRGFGGEYNHDTAKMATALNNHSVMRKNGSSALKEIADKDIKAQGNENEKIKVKDDQKLNNDGKVMQKSGV